MYIEDVVNLPSNTLHASLALKWKVFSNLQCIIWTTKTCYFVIKTYPYTTTFIFVLDLWCIEQNHTTILWVG